MTEHTVHALLATSPRSVAAAQAELGAEARGYTATKHQREVCDLPMRSHGLL